MGSPLQMQWPPLPAEELRPAGQMRRLLAGVVDGLILSAVGGALFVAGASLLSIAYADFWGMFYFVCILYGTAYHGPWGRGATIGKRIYSLKLVAMNGDFPPTGERVLRSAILYSPILMEALRTRSGFQGAIIGLLLIAIAVLNGLKIWKDSDGRGIHDRFASTLVHETNREEFSYNSAYGPTIAAFVAAFLVGSGVLAKGLPRVITSYGGQLSQVLQLRIQLAKRLNQAGVEVELRIDADRTQTLFMRLDTPSPLRSLGALAAERIMHEAKEIGFPDGISTVEVHLLRQDKEPLRVRRRIEEIP